MSQKVLVINYDRSGVESLVRRLDPFFSVVIFDETEADVLQVVGEERPNLLFFVLDSLAPGLTQLMGEIKERFPSVIVVAAVGDEIDVGAALEVWRSGVDDLIRWPQEVDQVEEILRRAGFIPDRPDSSEPVGFAGMVGQSRPFVQLVSFIREAARADKTPVLLQGETGTGKELAARAIHYYSPRRRGPFVAVNCGALNTNLLASELFGHERGAFTGAVARHIGYFERAHRGTLLLDEISELSPEGQVMLLRVLEESCFERVGGEKLIEVDVRVIAATNLALKSEVGRGRFRSDLYYRLAVMLCFLPPLRQRDLDVILLAESFISGLGREMKRAARGLTTEAKAALLRYRWPGNVRELRNVIERALAREEGDLITHSSLLFDVAPEQESGDGPDDPALSQSSGAALLPTGVSLDDLSRSDRRELLVRALQLTGGRRSAAARLLGLGSRHQLYRMMKKLGVEEPFTK